MLEYSSVCYKNSFLNQVIVRVDFAQFIQTNMVFDTNIEKEILKIFPRRGKDQIIRFNSINVVFDQKNNGLPNANGEIIEGIQREYFTIDGGNKLILSNKFIIFEINNYVRFEVHRQWFQSILLALFQRNRISATRTGIRYINIFDTSRIKLQKKYFTSEVASSLQVKLVEEENRPRLIRSMHMAEYRIDEMTMNFRYGMFNPEYPNFLKKNDFALDFDKGRVSGVAEGLAEIQQAIRLRLSTQAELFLIYPESYGLPRYQLQSKAMPIFYVEMKNRIIQTLMADDRIEAVYDFVFSIEENAVHVQFQVQTREGLTEGRVDL